ncbi:MAG: hypothetical protein ACFFBT_18045, partial [Promethearchaeota archaeon]
ENVSESIISDLKKHNIQCDEIGYVDKSNQVNIVYANKIMKEILPRFRESAYTKIKQEIGEEPPEHKEEMEKKIEEAAMKALEKRKQIIEHIKKI